MMPHHVKPLEVSYQGDINYAIISLLTNGVVITTDVSDYIWIGKDSISVLTLHNYVGGREGLVGLVEGFRASTMLIFFLL